MGSENRIQKLNRELRELATAARRDREEFKQFATRSRASRTAHLLRSLANDEPAGRSTED